MKVQVIHCNGFGCDDGPAPHFKLRIEPIDNKGFFTLGPFYCIVELETVLDDLDDKLEILRKGLPEEFAEVTRFDTELITRGRDQIIQAATTDRIPYHHPSQVN